MECNVAWTNLGRRAAPVAAAQMDTVVDEIQLLALTELVILMAIVPVLHMVAHGLFRRLAKSLGEAQRVAAAHHLVELIFGAIGTPIAFAATRRLIFCVPEETYTRYIVDTILGCSLGVCAMYASELAGRLSATRALTTVHHLLTLGLTIAILFDTNELMVATGALFVTGALAEFPLFAGLLLYRFRQGRERLAWWVFLVGVVSYAATRIIQISLHVAFCVFFDLGSFSTFTLVWVIGMGFALDCVQLYTFVIYRQILRKVMPRSGSGSSACHVKGQPHASELEVGTAGGFSMSSLDRQSTFSGSLSSERSHTDLLLLAKLDGSNAASGVHGGTGTANYRVVSVARTKLVVILPCFGGLLFLGGSFCFWPNSRHDTANAGALCFVIGSCCYWGA